MQRSTVANDALHALGAHKVLPPVLKFDGTVWKLHVSLSIDEGERVPSTMGKETNNGLEDPKDRRSAGRHGNQHVRLRGPEIIRISLSGSQ
jgi:hypothetical protein